MACVLVHIEADGDRPTPQALAALGEGRRIASALGATLYAAAVIPPPVVEPKPEKRKRGADSARGAAAAARRGTTKPGHGREELTRALGQGGADKVVLVTSEGARGPLIWATSGAALAGACEHLRPALVLFPSTAASSDIAPRLAARMGAAFVADAVLETGPRGEVLFSRAVYGGSYLRRIALDDLERTAVVTLPPGRSPARGGDDADVMLLDAGASRDKRVVHLGDSLSEGAELEDAEVVVTAGAGVTAQTWPLIAALARALGAQIGVTRSACARGLGTPDREVGVGARRVAPFLYVCVGASGSAAHLSGVSPDTEILAIDRDPEAPIFRTASYGLVGTIEDVLPKLLTALERGALMAREPSGVAVLVRRLQSRPGTSADDEVLGLCERGALTTALAIAGPLGMAVTAIAVGPARREDRVLAMALRAGCDRALRVSDDGVDELDYLGLAQVLAAAARHVGARVVTCGDRSQDEHTGALGPAVAELLSAAHVTQVIRVEVEDDALLVERVGDGSHQRFRVAPPVVLCVRPPPALPGVRPAAPEDDSDGDDARTRRAAALIRVPMIEEIDLGRLGIDRGALAHRKAPAGKLRQVRGRKRALVSPTATDLVSRLRSDQLVGNATPRRRRASSLSRPGGDGEPGAGT